MPANGHNQQISISSLFLLLILSSITASLPAFAQGAVPSIWKIGIFNSSSGEFLDRDINYTDPKSDPVFVVGKNGDKDWYRFQPGPANGVTGGRLHPFIIKFSLQQAPRGVYYLRIAMLYETPRLSFLKLDVNGHFGFFYFHPKLDFHAGDWEGTFVPQTSTDEKTIAIPAAWFHTGENQFVLTAMDDPATPQNSLGAIAPGHTGLIYDALELTQDPSAKYDDNAFNALVEPTIFYRGSGSTLSEVVDVFLNAAKLPEGGNVELHLGGKTFTKSYTTSNDFGELRFSFDIPEWEGSANATVHFGTLASNIVKVEPAKKWTVEIIPHEHLDVGFTDYPAKVAELHSQSIDSAMDLMDKTPDFRWTLDGSWVATQYLNARSRPSIKRFLDHVRAGSVVIPPEFANEHTGNASWDSLAHSLYNQHRLAREFNLPVADAAQIVDVPSYTWAYASLLHDAGIKYFIAASNGWRAPVTLLGRWNEKSPFWWEGPDGSRVLMWYSRAYLQAHTLFGGPWRMEAVRDALPVFLQAYTRPDYTANTAIIFGTQLENTTLAREQSEIAGRLNETYAWPHLEFATVHSAMQRIEREWKGQLAVYSGDFGPYWEDGYGSDAAYTAIHRENQHRIATAEILGSAVTSVDSQVHPDYGMIDDAWWNMLTYDEHTWTYVGATTQPEHHQSDDQINLKRARTLRARDDISESIQRESAQLEALVKPKDNSVIVFNSLNWPRNGFIEADLPDGSTLFESGTGKEIPCQTLWKGQGISLPGFGPVNVRVRCLVTDVPSVGYKVFSVKPSPTSAPEISMVTSNIIENQFYRITIDTSRGAIMQIFDKQLNRDLVDATSPYKFGEYLYVTGGDDYPSNSLYRFGNGLEPPVLTAHPAESGSVISAKKTPIGTAITLHSRAINTPRIETEILLPDSEKQIILSYHLHKDRVLARESAYIAFPFTVVNPQFTYGSQAGWVNPAKDELPGGSREWYLPTTWASVHNSEVTAAVVPLDAPLTAFGDIVRGTWPSEFQPKSSAIFSWLMNNYWGTNFPAWQGGDYTFRYAITSTSKFDPASLTRFGLNALTPLERDDISGSTENTTLPDGEASLLAIDDPGVTLLTWKHAEDGDGSILRLQQSSGKSSDVTIRSPYIKLQKAWLCSALEDNRAEIPVSGGTLKTSIKPFQVLTIRVRTMPTLAQGPKQ